MLSPRGAGSFLMIERDRDVLLTGPTDIHPLRRPINDNWRTPLTNHPTSRDITDGFPDDAFLDLTDRQREVIVHLLARASERAYRRGFQQGESIGRRRPEDMRSDIAAWRYGPSTDDSPWADAARIEPSTERLFTENRQLRRIGLAEPLCDAITGGIKVDRTYEPRG